MLVVFVAAACAIGLAVWQDRESAIRAGARDVRNTSILVGSRIEDAIQRLDAALREVQAWAGARDGRSLPQSLSDDNGPELHAWLTKLRNRTANADQITVADERGRIVLSTAAWPAPNVNVAGLDYFRELTTYNDDRMSLSAPVREGAGGQTVFVLARRIQGPGRTFLGVATISIRQSRLEDLYGSLAPNADQTFTLLRRDGTILVRFPHRPETVGVKIPPTFPFHDIVARGGGSVRSNRLFGQTDVSWIGVTPLDGYPLVANVTVPEETLLHDWRWRATIIVGGSLVFAALAFGLLTALVRQLGKLHESQAALADKTGALETEHARLLDSERELRANQAKLLASEAELIAQNGRFDAALNNMRQGLAMFDRDARLLVCNERYRASHRLSVEEARPGRPLRDILAHCHERCGFPADVDAYLTMIARIVSGQDSLTHEVTDGDGRIFEITNDPMAGGGWLVTFDDVTTRRAYESEIRILARNDPLTGIGNRSTFQERIQELQGRLLATGLPFNVLVVDLDRFKRVNDVFGHAAGDLLLKEAAHRLQVAIRADDLVARLGGDEFAIIQSAPRAFEAGADVAPAMKESAIALANRILQVIGEPFDVAGEKLHVGASIGIALAPRDGRQPDELMSKADLALYRAKSEGRNAYALFERVMGTELDQRRALGDDLRDALGRSEFELYYQPIFDVSGQRPCAMEALVRWRHPEHGLLTPDRFLAIAEDAGPFAALGEWILQAACAAAARWPDDVRLAINISPTQFRNPALFDMIVCALVDAGLPAERLEVEITERVLLEKDAEYLSTMHQLRNLGVSVVLDDFGSGQSSLGYLRMFPFDKIKLDGALVRELVDSQQAAAIACAVVNLCRSLDITAAAEGIETEAQFDSLRIAGFRQVQGFLLGRPQPAAKVAFDAPARGAEAWS